MLFCFECCVLSGRGLCDEVITHPEELYRLWYVVVVWSRNLKNDGGHDSRWVAAPQQKWKNKKSSLDIAWAVQKIDDYSHHRYIQYKNL
jgi:hypothetical protein